MFLKFLCLIKFCAMLFVQFPWNSVINGFRNRISWIFFKHFFTTSIISIKLINCSWCQVRKKRILKYSSDVLFTFKTIWLHYFEIYWKFLIIIGSETKKTTYLPPKQNISNLFLKILLKFPWSIIFYRYNRQKNISIRKIWYKIFCKCFFFDISLISM